MLDFGNRDSTLPGLSMQNYYGVRAVIKLVQKQVLMANKVEMVACECHNHCQLRPSESPQSTCRLVPSQRISKGTQAAGVQSLGRRLCEQNEKKMIGAAPRIWAPSMSPITGI